MSNPSIRGAGGRLMIRISMTPMTTRFGEIVCPWSVGLSLPSNAELVVFVVVIRRFNDERRDETRRISDPAIRPAALHADVVSSRRNFEARDDLRRNKHAAARFTVLVSDQSRHWCLRASVDPLLHCGDCLLLGFGCRVPVVPSPGRYHVADLRGPRPFVAAEFAHRHHGNQELVT